MQMPNVSPRSRISVCAALYVWVRPGRSDHPALSPQSRAARTPASLQPGSPASRNAAKKRSWFGVRRNGPVSTHCRTVNVGSII
jgi:hypothetical protein